MGQNVTDCTLLHFKRWLVQDSRVIVPAPLFLLLRLWFYIWHIQMNVGRLTNISTSIAYTVHTNLACGALTTCDWLRSPPR